MPHPHPPRVTESFKPIVSIFYTPRVSAQKSGHKTFNKIHILYMHYLTTDDKLIKLSKMTYGGHFITIIHIFVSHIMSHIWNIGGYYFYLPRRRRPGPGDIATVCPSVTFSFRTVTQKRIDVFSRNFAGTCTMTWGVCCIVIDGMLFEFFKYWNAISNIKKKIGVKKNQGGEFFFLEKQLSLISRFMLFSTLQKKYWKVPLHLLVKWEVVYPNSR